MLRVICCWSFPWMVFGSGPLQGAPVLVAVAVLAPVARRSVSVHGPCWIGPRPTPHRVPGEHGAMKGAAGLLGRARRRTESLMEAGQRRGQPASLVPRPTPHRIPYGSGATKGAVGHAGPRPTSHRIPYGHGATKGAAAGACSGLDLLLVQRVLVLLRLGCRRASVCVCSVIRGR